MAWTIVGIVLGILGLIASISGSILAYFAFIDPRKRLVRYLDKVDSWDRIHTTLGGHEDVWRYQRHPEFAIEIKDDSRDWDSGAKEPWMTMPLPDPKKTMYMVHATINGTVLYAEKFIALDGWRYFVPLPRIELNQSHDLKEDVDKDNRKFFYDEIQIQLAKMIGKLHGDNSIEEFASRSKIKIPRVENG